VPSQFCRTCIITSLIYEVDYSTNLYYVQVADRIGLELELCEQHRYQIPQTANPKNKTKKTKAQNTIQYNTIQYNKMPLDVDECIAVLKKGDPISESQLRQLCQKAGELLIEESNVQPVTSPVTVVGDLHGQFFDLLNIFETVGGWPPHTSYVFLGDLVDRGHHSVETLSLLLCLKLKFPAHVTLLRGNHEVSLCLLQLPLRWRWRWRCYGSEC